jgi:hypothetical protein
MIIIIIYSYTVPAISHAVLLFIRSRKPYTKSGMRALPALVSIYAHSQSAVPIIVASPLPISCREGVWPVKTDLVSLNGSPTPQAF